MNEVIPRCPTFQTYNHTILKMKRVYIIIEPEVSHRRQLSHRILTSLLSVEGNYYGAKKLNFILQKYLIVKLRIFFIFESKFST